jgi:hypothetical protein
VNELYLQDEVMKLIGDEWISGKELAEQIAEKNPEEFKKAPYLGDISKFTKALGPVLWALRNKKKIVDDGAKYPAAARWKRAEPGNSISVEEAARALVKVHLANDEKQAIRMLASRTIREHKPEFEEYIQAANRNNEEALKIGRKMLGIKSE